MPKYPSVTCTLPEYAAWVRWWCSKEEKRILKGNLAANPEKVRQSVGLLSDAMGRWLQTAEDFAQVCCNSCGATGVSKITGAKGKKLPCSKCEGRGYIKEKDNEAGPPRLKLAGPEDEGPEAADTDEDAEPPTD